MENAFNLKDLEKKKKDIMLFTYLESTKQIEFSYLCLCIQCTILIKDRVSIFYFLCLSWFKKKALHHITHVAYFVFIYKWEDIVIPPGTPTFSQKTTPLLQIVKNVTSRMLQT